MDKSNLSPKISKLCDDFVNGLRAVYGNELVSAALYGSAASGEYASANSNLNVAVILDDAGLANVARAADLFTKRKFRQIRPVFFTEKYIAGSTDVFPLEFLDMKENHLTLYGKDVMKSVNVNEKNLRFQCEQELKSKLINIKAAFLDNRSTADRRTLLFKFTSSALHLLRNVLRLKGRTPLYSKEDTARVAAEAFGLDDAVFKKVLDARHGKLKLNPKEVDHLLIKIAADLEKITEAVDRM